MEMGVRAIKRVLAGDSCTMKMSSRSPLTKGSEGWEVKDESWKLEVEDGG